MQIRRTANAGVLLKLDGVSILLDGVCQEVKPYLATPPQERAALSACYPDVVAYTHAHKDHYDLAFAGAYQRQTNGVIFGPEDLPGCRASMTPVRIGAVKVTPIASRHIGAAGKTTSHASFIIEGSKCVWFLGDASPLIWKNIKGLPHPDVLIVPYAYATTEVAWTVTQGIDPDKIILLHLPEREDDAAELWDAVEATAGSDSRMHILQMGECLQLL